MRPKPASHGSAFNIPVPKFQKALAKWYKANARDLPWRNTAAPYAIWISEIMLQQTRVAAVIPYYHRFLEQFPTVAELAAVSEPELLAAWSGLGYYSRARNVQKAARQIVELGSFPSNYKQIRELSGVGDYTASSVSSIAFGLPYAAVDGNVVRVTCRIVAETGDVASAEVRQALVDVAGKLMDRGNPGLHNQAMMELGATVCLPRQPQCHLCPVETMCQAKALGIERELPFKPKKMEIFRKQRTLLLVEMSGRLLCWQQPADAKKMAGFWELPELEHLPDVVLGEPVGEFRHSITNHIYHFLVFRAKTERISDQFHWLDEEQMKNLPMSTTSRKALQLFTLVTHR